MSEDTFPKQGGAKTNRPHLLSYLVILFSAAFLLLLLSYFMQQRRSDQQVIDGLQQNISAMQTTQNVIERNKALIDENQTLRQRNDELEEQAEHQAELQELQKQTILALDYLWRIEREYFQGRYAAARELIQAFEEAGLEAHLPEEPISDPDYRSPMQQYKSIYNLLF
jgi:regulator of replication initiation timing